MPTPFGHTLFASAIGTTYKKVLASPWLWVAGVGCALLPDADVLMFKLQVPYHHWLGHRGFFHSVPFAILVGSLLPLLLSREARESIKRWALYASYFSLCMASNGLLDTLTNGGLGVALFSPFDLSRYFAPWRPIRVSPIGVTAFVQMEGLRVLVSELLWVGVPCLLYVGSILSYKWYQKAQSPPS